MFEGDRDVASYGYRSLHLISLWRSRRLFGLLLPKLTEILYNKTSNPMSNQARSFPFRWVLPITQLLVCAVVLWPLRSDFVTEIGASIDEYHGHPRVFKFKASPEQEQLLERYEKQHPLSAEDRLLFRLPLEDKHSAQVRQRRVDIKKVLKFSGGLVNFPYSIWGSTTIYWDPPSIGIYILVRLKRRPMSILLWWVA